MQDNQPSEKKLDILDIIKKSFLLYKANFSLLFLISLLAYSIPLLEQLFFALNISIGWFGLVSFIGGLIISFWGHAALIFAASEKYSQRDVTVKESFINTKSKIWRLICISIFYTFLFLGGFLLCAVPGLYFGTIFGLAGMLVVLEDRAFFEYLKRSKNLIRGYFWPVFLLGGLLSFISLPILGVYFLNISVKIKMFSMVIFLIMYSPFGTAIIINLYYRLKQLKKEEELPQAEVTKKGAGCLGCLAGIGLFIVIIILSFFWIKNLIDFVKTDKGIKYYEWFANKVSPAIVFPGDVSLERPEGYLVLKELLQYTFYGVKENKFFMFTAFSIPLKDLGIEDKTAVSLGEGFVLEKYFEYLTGQSPYTEKPFSGMEQEPINILQMNGNAWAKLTLRQEEVKHSKSRKVRVYVYTLTDNDVIFFLYSFNEKDDDQLKRSSEIESILEKINFPE